MKKILAGGLSAVLCLILLSGCGSGKYSVYTNLPEGSFSLTDGRFTLGAITGNPPAIPEGKKSDITLKTSGTSFYDIMTSDAEIAVTYEEGPQSAERYAEFVSKVTEVLTAVNNSLSVSIEGSSVKAFNSAPAGATVEVDEIAFEVLGIAKRAYEFTGGYYNPAVYYSAELYGFITPNGVFKQPETLPDRPSVGPFKELSSHFGEIELSENEGKYYAEKPSAVAEIGGVQYPLKLDLGGVGKGYATDLISALMDEYGFSYGYFDFGSSSMVCKSHHKNGSYNFELRNPRADYFGQTFFSTKISNVCLASSSDDVRYYMKDGVRYCHIIDPFTGSPVQSGIISATVIGGSAAEDDAYSTAIMAMGREKAIEFLNKLDRAAGFVCGE